MPRSLQHPIPFRQVSPLDRPRPRRGHRREVDPRREQRSFQERLDRSLADVGLYRSVSLRDLSEGHFGGHPYTTRRAVERLKRDGSLEEHTVKGPKGNKFKVLTLTESGAEQARQLTQQLGLDPNQQTWSGLVKQGEVVHDTAIYRAGQVEAEKLREVGATLKRIRLDAELKREIASRTEKARTRSGKAAADEARRQAARELGLPIQDGKVLYPDAQLEYENEEGRTGRVNIEVVSGDYHSKAIAAKARAGFALYGHGGGSARIGRTLRHLDRRPAGGTRGPADRGEGAIEL